MTYGTKEDSNLMRMFRNLEDTLLFRKERGYLYKEDDLCNMYLKMDLCCEKCTRTFSSYACQCGHGLSWALYRCPSCEQYYAGTLGNGSVPSNVLDDKEIIILKGAKSGV